MVHESLPRNFYAPLYVNVLLGFDFCEVCRVRRGWHLLVEPPGITSKVARLELF